MYSHIPQALSLLALLSLGRAQGQGSFPDYKAGETGSCTCFYECQNLGSPGPSSPSGHYDFNKITSTIENHLNERISQDNNPNIYLDTAISCSTGAGDPFDSTRLDQPGDFEIIGLCLFFEDPIQNRTVPLTAQTKLPFSLTDVRGLLQQIKCTEDDSATSGFASVDTLSRSYPGFEHLRLWRNPYTLQRYSTNNASGPF